MKEMMLQKYVNMLTKNDIIKFSNYENVNLSNDEVDLIYDVVKNDWKTLVYGDYKVILNRYQNKFSNEKLKKIEELILLYKDKYKNYI